MIFRFMMMLSCGMLLLAIRPSTAAIQDNGQLDDDELTVLRTAETVVQIGRQFHDSIWPGYDLSEMPLMIYIPDKWALLLNAPPSADGFTGYPETWPDLQTHVLYHSGSYDDLSGQLAFDVEIDSLAVAAVSPLGRDERSMLEYVTHENFHQFQDQHFGEITWQREELYPIEDVRNTALACLELYLLKDAIELLQQSDYDAFNNRVAEFVAVRSYRWQMASDYLREYEQGLEIKEGTAKYVEMKAMSLIPELRYASAFEGDNATLTSSLQNSTMDDFIIDGLDERITDGTIAPEDMPRNRVYPLGAAEGYILDQLGIDWKPQAQAAGAEFTFTNLMKDGLQLEDSRYEALVDQAREKYGYNEILQKTEESIRAYRAGYDSSLASFNSQPGIRVELKFSGKNMLRSRNSSSKKWLVENGSRELRDHFNIYTLRSMTGPEFNFSLLDAGLLEITDWATKDKDIVFYCPDIDSLSVNGVDHDMNNKSSYQFETIHLHGSNFELSSDRPGTISNSDNVVEINFTP